MASGAPGQPQHLFAWQGRPICGYDAAAVQESYIAWEAAAVADFFLPYLQSGMTLLDCGCGPGALTLGLAAAVAPAQVVGIDLEPGMIARAMASAMERKVDQVRFQIANICELPFPDRAFDVVFTSAVLEHLSNPGQALKEMCRVLQPGGCAGIINTDWGEPLISPPDESMRQFFELFERGFQHHGGSLNRGRHLRQMMRQAGFTVIDFAASFHNATTPEAVQRAVAGYIAWMEHLPLFDEAIQFGWVDRPTLERMPSLASGPPPPAAAARVRRWRLPQPAAAARHRLFAPRDAE